jgi:L-threonylcarbamoyladenylate synthase
VDLILDGGACSVGIESTVLSVIGNVPVLLRPGMVSASDIEALIGPVQRAGEPHAGAHQSPGQHVRHYRPRKPLYLVGRGDPLPQGPGAYLWRSKSRPAAISIQMPGNAAEFAARLYGMLHELDHCHVDWIAVERPPEDAAWEAVADRLRRAATAIS